MLRLSRCALGGNLGRPTTVMLGVFHNAPSTYPFLKPFHDTPHDQDRHRHDASAMKHTREHAWPKWMDEGADGTGFGIGLHRTHPLSKLRGNLSRSHQNVPRIFEMMIKGVWHKSGRKLYFAGGKPPNPSTHPFLTGEPCPVYGWKVTDPNVVRAFNVPHVEKEKMRYRPYVALQERKIFGETAAQPTPSSKDVAKASDSDKQQKPLMKRLFFWK